MPGPGPGPLAATRPPRRSPRGGPWSPRTRCSRRCAGGAPTAARRRRWCPRTAGRWSTRPARSPSTRSGRRARPSGRGCSRTCCCTSGSATPSRDAREGARSTPRTALPATSPSTGSRRPSRSAAAPSCCLRTCRPATRSRWPGRGATPPSRRSWSAAGSAGQARTSSRTKAALRPQDRLGAAVRRRPHRRRHRCRRRRRRCPGEHHRRRGEAGSLGARAALVHRVVPAARLGARLAHRRRRGPAGPRLGHRRRRRGRLVRRALREPARPAHRPGVAVHPRPRGSARSPGAPVPRRRARPLPLEPGRGLRHQPVAGRDGGGGDARRSPARPRSSRG